MSQIKFGYCVLLIYRLKLSDRAHYGHVLHGFKLNCGGISVFSPQLLTALDVFSTPLPKLLATVIRLYEFGLSNGLSFPLCTGVIRPCLNRFGISQMFIIHLASSLTCSIKASPPTFRCSLCRTRISAAFPLFYCLITVLTRSSET